MEAPPEYVQGILPHLRSLVVHEKSDVITGMSWIDDFSYPILPDSAVKDAFRALPRLFPFIEIASHVKSEHQASRHKDHMSLHTLTEKRMEMHYPNTAGITIRHSARTTSSWTTPS